MECKEPREEQEDDPMVSKVLCRINSRPVYPQSVRWSADNHIAFMTQRLLTIVTPNDRSICSLVGPAAHQENEVWKGVHSIHRSPPAFCSLAWAPAAVNRSALLACCSSFGNVQVFSLSNGLSEEPWQPWICVAQLKEGLLGPGLPLSVAWTELNVSPLLAVGTDEGALSFWKLERAPASTTFQFEQVARHQLDKGCGWVSALRWVKNAGTGLTLCVGTTLGFVFVCSLTSTPALTVQCMFTVNLSGRAVHALDATVTQDNVLVVAAAARGDVVLLQPATELQLSAAFAHMPTCSGVLLRVTGNTVQIVSTGSSGLVRVWTPQPDGQALKEVEADLWHRAVQSTAQHAFGPRAIEMRTPLLGLALSPDRLLAGALHVAVEDNTNTISQAVVYPLSASVQSFLEVVVARRPLATSPLFPANVKQAWLLLRPKDENEAARVLQAQASALLAKHAEECAAPALKRRRLGWSEEVGKWDGAADWIRLALLLRMLLHGKLVRNGENVLLLNHLMALHCAKTLEVAPTFRHLQWLEQHTTRLQQAQDGCTVLNDVQPFISVFTRCIAASKVPNEVQDACPFCSAPVPFTNSSGLEDKCVQGHVVHRLRTSLAIVEPAGPPGRCWCELCEGFGRTNDALCSLCHLPLVAREKQI